MEPNTQPGQGAQIPPQVPPQMPSQGMPPQMTPTMPSQPDISGSQPVTDQQKQELLALIETIRQKLGSFHAQDFAGKNKVDRTKKELLRQVFQVLQQAGVDLTDRQSVANFIDKLRQQNPQLADQFEQSMSYLLGESTGAPIMPGDPNATMDLGVSQDLNQNMNINNTNPNEDLSQNV